MNWREVRLLLGIFSAVLLAASSLLPMQGVHADDILKRRLVLQAGSEDGGSAAGGEVHHQFEFTVPSTGVEIASIEFLYCTTASGTCTMPDGLDTTGTSLGHEAGLTGWTLENAANGAPYLTRGSAAEPTAGDLEYQLQEVINPTAENETFFVRISTYESNDTTGTPVDEGTVAASTATQIELTGIMPESLVFCTGETIDMTNGIPDCTTATDGLISFNQLFSSVDTATATSQMAASTNANFGYTITVNGTTMMSGSNEIDPMATAAPGNVGSGQFGLNLRENTIATSDPAVGDDVDPAPNGDDFKGQPSADYDIVDEFKFLSGDIVAASDNDGAGPTNSQIFTISYIVNVPGSQPAGTYTTTLTYISTANF